jgi:DNA-binding MarR family transcriptional regulator
MKQPTPVQLQYIEAIEEFWQMKGIGPTQRDLADYTGREQPAVASMLERLQDAGFIHPMNGLIRNIRTTRMEIAVTIHKWLA